ncbi:Myosin type-2 heavy chain [Seminavis robusta]|uniref:Myosin type-2 heavy chain n=1 Tax=Seminavis robusta TaxID=568900 RepID=A0A9N8DJS3_9STRA|nr:Myosin type-2 heavy chain [Seminavis robusta]|eukprot:Sro191_g082340.1 Myosin type-2 heavy chain (1146) ;mRNA; r:73688-77221
MVVSTTATASSRSSMNSGQTATTSSKKKATDSNRVWVKMEDDTKMMDGSMGSGSSRRVFSKKQPDAAPLSPKSTATSDIAPKSPMGASSRRAFGSGKSSSTASSTGSSSVDAPVIVRAAAPWRWKLGVMLENSATEGLTIRLVDGATGHELAGDAHLLQLPADALRTRRVLPANSYPRDKQHGQLLCPADLISLTHLHEASVVECLVHRYHQEKIYTNTGPVLLALNPFQTIHGLYDDATMRQYWHHAESNTDEELPPHVYAVADATFRGMMRKLEMATAANQSQEQFDCNQSILVSGESGAGKTVTMKFAMKYLAALSQRLADFYAKAGTPSYLTLTKKDGKKKGGSGAIGRTITDPLALRGHTFAVKTQPSLYVPMGTSSASKRRGSLATASTLSNQTDSIENKVLQSNPILESFGNARTIRNDNSSRFGKFIQMQFTRYGKLIGAEIETYLLEKVRILTQTPGERNYHIFYEFLSGGMDFRELKTYHFTSKQTPADFKICASSNTFDRRDGVPDSDTYRELRRAMHIMHFSAETQKDIFNVTAAILHSSNLTWMEVDGTGESAVDQSNPHLEAVCQLLEVTPEDMTQSLCYYSITVRDNVVRKSLSKEKTEHGFEALLKALYGALFTSLVRRINQSISYKKKPTKSAEPTEEGEEEEEDEFVIEEEDDPMHVPACFIGILDIFGFESFTVNSFEQLCINYCNETLQMQFSSFILKNEQKEYEKEGIKWDFIDFAENQDVLDLIERKSGIIGILDDMCRAPGTTDRVFCDTLYKNCTTSSVFTANKKQTAMLMFTIHHYAGPVEYTADGFVEKNRDELPKESTEFLRKSPNEFVRELAEIIEGSVNVSDGTSNNGGGKGRKQLARTVGGQFRDQLKDLRVKIEKTTPCYIRCLKPNDLLVPNRFEIPIVAEQLRCGGVLEAVRVARAGFTQHYPHVEFVRRYRPLVWREWQKKAIASSSDVGDVCRKLIDALFEKLQHLEASEKKDGGDGPRFVKLGMQMGKTKVFLRQREFEGLERQRGHEQGKAALLLNATFRGYLVRIKWAEYVPLLERQKNDFLNDREKRLREEAELRAQNEKSMSDIAANFAGTGELLLREGERELVAGKVASKNPVSIADAMKKGPSGDFKWVERNGAWVKKFLNED